MSNTLKRPRYVFLFTLVSSIYWVVGQLVNVHASNLLILYEFLWLPMLLLLFGMPIVALVFWIKDKFNLRSLYFYALLIGAATIVYLLTKG